MFFNKDDGVALVLVMFLIVIGGILIPLLMKVSETHIDVAQHKEAMSKSFYAADSGVEFVKANISNIDFEESEIDEYLNINNLEFKDNNNWFGKGDFDFDGKGVQEIKFRIKVIGKDPLVLISEGEYYSGDSKYRKKVQFEIKNNGNIDKNFNIQKKSNEDNQDHYKISGGKGIEDSIGVSDWKDGGFKSSIAKFLSDELIYKDGNEFKFNKDNFDEQTNTIENSKEGVSILSEGNLKIGKKLTIDNSIVVVDGNIEDTGNHIIIKNSVIIVSGYVDLRGASSSEDWVNPIFLVYGNDKIKGKNVYFNISGGGNFNIIFDELPEEVNIGKVITNWRQKF